MAVQAPKGTKDVIPSEAYKWHYMEDIIRERTDVYGYKEIRTPVFEHTELFLRGVGETTDVVQKEMYTFLDKGNRSITLKPEGTASTVRAFIEHSLYNNALPLKTYYFTPVFRYERPQAGRLREHHQFGVEVFGAPSVTLDAELIVLALDVLGRLGAGSLSLNINSIGCPVCREKYNKALVDFMQARRGDLCTTCNDRLEKNPLRILDCKVPSCQLITKDAPVILDYLCEDCAQHMAALEQLLTSMDIAYTVDPHIVRGLDYYTKTVFEIIYTQPNGEPITVCGGGRYDNLVKQIGDISAAGAGFGMGLERLLMVLQAEDKLPMPQDACEVFIATMGSNGISEGFALVAKLRTAGVRTELNHCEKSVKAQLKYADKIGAQHVIVIGDNEVQGNEYTIKNMQTGEAKIAPKKEVVNILRGENHG